MSAFIPQGANIMAVGPCRIPKDFGNAASEYTAITQRAGLYLAGLRGLIEITGRDRVNWLNNLVTNALKDLPPGAGRYAFATDRKGRILADFNMLVRPEAIWLDVDRRMIPALLTHLEHYHITEDVTIRDLSDGYERFAVLGPQAPSILATLGLVDGAWPLLGIRELLWNRLPAGLSVWDEPPVCQAAAESPAGAAGAGLSNSKVTILALRTDLAGVFAVELFVPADGAVDAWAALLTAGAAAGLQPVGHTAVESARIEAGIPASISDINEDVLPAETLQTDRAVDYKKGCYLGQEVVERMRSRGALRRQLVGLRQSGTHKSVFVRADSPGAPTQTDLSVPPADILQVGGAGASPVFLAGVTLPLPLYADGAEVGRLTSLCQSFALNATIGLGYVKMSHTEGGTKLQVRAGSDRIETEVGPLPMRTA